MSATSAGDALSVDLIVPTFRRPVLLDRCLAAVATQERSPARILVVAREDDKAAHEVLNAHRQRLPTLEIVVVREPGVLAAMSAGVAASTGEVLAFTDDDAAPRPHWLATLIRHFEDPAVGAVGGRDVIPGQDTPLTAHVGRFERSGRLHGNHHLGTGPARDVDVLKGVNMAFRAGALVLPAPGVLRGTGAQVDFEILCCGCARLQGWRVVYDPAVLVDHEGGPREGADRRLRPARSAVFDAAFNSIVASSGSGAVATIKRAGFGLGVGTRDRPGLLRTLAALVGGEREVLRRATPAFAGRLLGVYWLTHHYLRQDGPPVVTVAELRSLMPARPSVVLVAHDVHDSGGMERACAELIRGLHDAFDITVVSATLTENLRPLVRWRRVRVPRRPFGLKFVAFFVGAAVEVRRTDSSLVHTVGAIIPNRVDVATVQFCHAGAREALGGLAPAGAPALRRLNTSVSRSFALRAEKWCYRPSRLRRFASVSVGVGDEARRYYPGVRSVTTPNGVDLDRFEPDRALRSAVRRELDIADQVIALFVGGDWDRKGLTIAIEATAKARAGGFDIRLWVVGPGDVERFSRFASVVECGDMIRFFGRRSDTERYYQGADLFLFPTAYEAFSLVMLEAAASGLPLIVPPVNGASELVGNDEAGMIVDRDSTNVAAALAALAADPARRRAQGIAARRRASGFTWAHSATSVAELYRELLTSQNEHEAPSR